MLFMCLSTNFFTFVKFRETLTMLYSMTFATWLPFGMLKRIERELLLICDTGDTLALTAMALLGALTLSCRQLQAGWAFALMHFCSAALGNSAFALP